MSFGAPATTSGAKDIRLLLDTNEYIFGLTGLNKPSALLLDTIAIFPGVRVHVPSTVIAEATRNLARVHSRLADAFTHLVYGYPKFNVLADEDVPDALLKQYQDLRLRQEDALIGACAHWVHADFLVSENQHFLKDLRTTAYRVLSAEDMVVWLLGTLA